MSRLRNVAKVGIVALALGGTVAVTAGTATADPNNGFQTYSAVGSDTTQAVWNALANSPNPTAKKPKPGVIPNVGSYDATGQTPVQTSPNGPAYTRPVGSGNGAKALSAAWDPNNHVWAGSTLSQADVAFSRSSSQPNTTSYPGSDLTYIPFARDAVSVAIKPAGSSTPTNFTTAQLTAIYGGPDDNTANSGVSYASDGNPVVNGTELQPLLPQSGSGTRTFFLTAIGNPSLASYVSAGTTSSPIIENDGSYVSQPGQLIPFSAAQWIAQYNGVQTSTISGLQMTKINNLAPFTGTKTLVAGPLFGTATKGVYNTPPTPGTGTFARDTYDVVPTSYFNSGNAQQQTLLTELTGSGAGDLGNSKAKAVIKKYGFGVLSYIADQNDYLQSGFQH